MDSRYLLATSTIVLVATEYRPPPPPDSETPPYINPICLDKFTWVHIFSHCLSEYLTKLSPPVNGNIMDLPMVTCIIYSLFTMLIGMN